MDELWSVKHSNSPISNSHLLGFLYPISRLISYSVFEKEQKIRGLYMMGLEDGIFHLSWFIAYDLQFAVSFAIITVCTMDNLFKYLRVPVPSTQLSDQDFLSHLIDLNAQVFDNDLPSHLPDLTAQAIGQFLPS
ncbi:hypothetical protein GBA52_014938 [Prunus armeniaca]|nr:hypothetical protein GBA52_014938 [Prunus armeniaca]